MPNENLRKVLADHHRKEMSGSLGGAAVCICGCGQGTTAACAEYAALEKENADLKQAIYVGKEIVTARDREIESLTAQLTDAREVMEYALDCFGCMCDEIGVCTDCKAQSKLKAVIKAAGMKENEVTRRSIPVPTETLNMIYEQTGGTFGSDPDAYGRAVEQEYKRLNSLPNGDNEEGENYAK